MSVMHSLSLFFEAQSTFSFCPLGDVLLEQLGFSHQVHHRFLLDAQHPLALRQGGREGAAILKHPIFMLTPISRVKDPSLIERCKY